LNLLPRDVLSIEVWCLLEVAIDIDVVDFLLDLLYGNTLGGIERVYIGEGVGHLFTVYRLSFNFIIGYQ
jgi:hypothetical protein